MKYLRASFCGLGIWIISFPIFMLLSFAVCSLAYPAFVEWFPDIVPKYSFVTQREDYERLYSVLRLIAAVLTVIISSHISVRFDNERMEYMITETEGLYTLKEGAGIYYSSYLTADAVCAFILPLPLLLVDKLVFPLLSFLPESLLSLLVVIFEPSRAFSSVLGVLLSYFAMAALFFVARTFSGFRSIAIWRAAWLSDIEYVG